MKKQETSPVKKSAATKKSTTVKKSAAAKKSASPLKKKNAAPAVDPAKKARKPVVSAADKEFEKKAKERVKEAEKLAAFCATIADDRKAENIVLLKLADISTVTDFFILCTANSEPHLRAISDWIVKEAREKLGAKPRKVDGNPESHWIVIDYSNVLIHVMTAEARELYQLESLWGDAPTVNAIKTLRKKTPAQ